MIFYGVQKEEYIRLIINSSVNKYSISIKLNTLLVYFGNHLLMLSQNQFYGCLLSAVICVDALKEQKV